MNNRERLHAIMNYEKPDRMPAVHFGFTPEVVEKWVKEGHLNSDILELGEYSYEQEEIIGDKLGFDFGWHASRLTTTELFPFFEEKIVEHMDNGFVKYLNSDGVYILQKPGAGSIPAEVGHILTDRTSWETYYLPKLTYTEERFSHREFSYLQEEQRKGNPIGLHCGSLCGRIRDYLGLVGLSYLMADDEELLEEMFHTIGELCVASVRRSLASGLTFDYAHFWEDMCYKNGPLISPDMFEEYTAPYYKKITDLLSEHNIQIVSVDCDGMIDRYLPIWLENGINTMFPIEVGTWNASIEPWRSEYGTRLRGIGGMRKQVFALDYTDIDQEIQRLRTLASLSGYIPCPDHRIPVDAKWENVQYYCEQIKKL